MAISRSGGGYGPSASADTLKALVFPSNISGADQSAPFVALKFTNPHSNGLPLWGPSGQGVTVIRRYMPAQQTGYYAAFWYADDSSFEESKSGTLGYYGFHPYPQNASNTGTTHYWEVASDDGGDFTNTDGGSPLAVVKDVWYLQALQVVRNGASDKTLKFYIDLPSTATSNIITGQVNFSNYGEGNPPQTNPQITIGDSPWYGTYQHERASGRIGQIKIIAKALSQADILSEAANMSALVTTDGQNNIWWGKKGFVSVDDLTCDYGTGRSFVWADVSNKGTLGSL